MQAIILAAGRGSRLGSLTEEQPKAFLEISGIKLIEYNIALLRSHKVQKIILVTGYKNDLFEALTSSMREVICVYNPFYSMMNVLGSFYMAQHALSNDDTIYMHGDTLCDPQILDDMIKATADIVLPVDFRNCDEEAMKVLTVNGHVNEISKQIPCDKAEGEFIGIAKLSKKAIPLIKTAAKKVLQREEFTAYFEAAIQELINDNSCSIQSIPTAGRFWGEIDFLEDYQYVKNNLPNTLIEIARKELPQ